MIVAATLFLPTRSTGAAGDLDPTFGVGGKVTTAFTMTLSDSRVALALQSDGKLVAAGESDRDFGLARYLPDGSLDGTFGVGGRVVTDFGSGDMDRVAALVVQPDGKLVAAGMALGNPGGADFGLARYLPDGSLDGTFGTGGRVVTDFASFFEAAYALVRQPDGKLVAAGGPPFLLARYLPDGSLDPTFGVGGKVTTDFAGGTGWINAIVVQPDGKLVVGGFHLVDHFILARYLPDGTLDPTFGSGGRVTTDFGTNSGVMDLVLQPDGKLVAAGGIAIDSGTPPTDFMLARYLPDGSLDATFGTAGQVVTDFDSGSSDRADALVLQSDGKLIAAGLALWSSTSDQHFGLARYNPDGTLDGSFGTSGKVTTSFGANAWATALVLQPDGKPVAAGRGPGYALARYLPDEPTCPVVALAALPGPQGTVETARLDPGAFRRFRDQVLARTPAGRRFTTLYSAHGPEVVKLLLTDSALRAAVRRGLLLWQDDISALADGRAKTVTVTSEQAQVIDEVVNRLAAVGSPRLRQAIAAEQRRLPPRLGLAKGLLHRIGH